MMCQITTSGASSTMSNKPTNPEARTYNQTVDSGLLASYFFNIELIAMAGHITTHHALLYLLFIICQLRNGHYESECQYKGLT